MPRLKKREGPYEKMTRLLKAYDLAHGPTLAAAIGCSTSTAFRRLDNPGDLTISELRKINRAGVPIEEIRAAM